MLYPSLEDMKVDQLMTEQLNASSSIANASSPQYPTNCNSMRLPFERCQLYPALNDYMGLDLSSEEVMLIQESQNALVARQTMTVSTPATGESMIAPLSGNSLGLKKAQISHGLREVTLCKDENGKVGLRVKAINKGVFIVLVHVNSPASMVGLRFGDQILQINDEIVAGYSMDKVHDLLRRAPTNNIRMVVRDRPFERTITLHKDSTGHTGFSFKNGRINAIVKDSSAARNGLLIDHNLLEVNGQNVVGLEDKVVREIIESGGNVITLTLMPSPIYDHMMKQMASSLVKKLMDHSIPDI